MCVCVTNTMLLFMHETASCRCPLIIYLRICLSSEAIVQQKHFKIICRMHHQLTQKKAILLSIFTSTIFNISPLFSTLSLFNCTFFTFMKNSNGARTPQLARKLARSCSSTMYLFYYYCNGLKLTALDKLRTFLFHQSKREIEGS